MYGLSSPDGENALAHHLEGIFPAKTAWVVYEGDTSSYFAGVSVAGIGGVAGKSTAQGNGILIGASGQLYRENGNPGSAFVNFPANGEFQQDEFDRLFQEWLSR